MGELTNMKLMTRIVRAPQVILIALSKCKFILLLHGPLDVQYNNSECRPAKFSCEFRLFSFIIKLSYCKKSQAFKLLYLKNNLYRQKIIKNLHIRHYYGYPGFQGIAASRLVCVQTTELYYIWRKHAPPSLKQKTWRRFAKLVPGYR